jgi:hypothetical protein
MWWIICGPMFLVKAYFRLAQTPKVWREPLIALPPDRFDFYPSFTHHFHSLFRMTSEPAWYRRISQVDFISH